MAKQPTYFYPPIEKESWISLSNIQEQLLDKIIFEQVERLEVNEDYLRVAAYANHFHRWETSKKAIYFPALYGLLENHVKGRRVSGNPHSPDLRREFYQKEYGHVLNNKPLSLIFVASQNQGISFSFFFCELVMDQLREALGPHQAYFKQFYSQCMTLEDQHEKLISEGKNPEYISESIYLELENLVNNCYDWMVDKFGQIKGLRYIGRAYATVERYYLTYPSFWQVIELLPSQAQSPSEFIWLRNFKEDG